MCKMWRRKCQGTYETPSRAIRGKGEGCEHPSQRFFTDEFFLKKHTVHTSRNEQETRIYVWPQPHLPSRTSRNPGDIDIMAQNFDKAIREQKRKDQDALELMKS